MASTPVRTEPNFKRRKIRKGTSSCWECKHRKRRCEFEPESSSVCVSCQRRGTPCISQEYEEHPEDEYKALGDNIDRVEDLLSHLIQEREAQSRRQDSRDINGAPWPFDVTKYSTLRSVNHERMSRGSSLTGYLNATLPAPHVAATIFSSNKQYNAPLQILQNDHHDPDFYADQRTKIPGIFPTLHPIALARRLITLALCLREIDEGKSQHLNLGFEEPAVNIGHRYFQTASSLVMSQDYLVSSLDGLETLLLQSRYHISMGELHVAWQIYKRASRIAHIMDVPQQAKIIGTRAHSVWFQLIYCDCFLSIMLGQPIEMTESIVGATESPPVSNPAQSLERAHVIIAQRIVARNLCIQHCHERERTQIVFRQSYGETKALDLQLKMGARTMPTAWWMSPKFADQDLDREIMEKTAKLLIQTHQHYLLVMLHQPYIILQFPCNHEIDDYNPIDYMYSTMAVVAASREVLTRYHILRNFHRSPSYRGFDEKAFTASLALLFAHLSGHRRGSANVLEHQRPHDLGVLENVIDCMEKISSMNRDAQGSARAQSLRQFMKIEAEAADGSQFLVCGADGVDNNKQNKDVGRNCDFEIPMPYFGTIRLIRQISEKQGVDLATATHLSHIASKISSKSPEREMSLYRESDSKWLDDWVFEEDNESLMGRFGF
jgi:hypothetical protein